MHLPDKLQERSYMEWNYLVKGLMTLWDLACLMEWDQNLEQALLQDADGALTEQLADLGHECSKKITILGHGAEVRAQSYSQPNSWRLTDRDAKIAPSRLIDSLVWPQPASSTAITADRQEA